MSGSDGHDRLTEPTPAAAGIPPDGTHSTDALFRGLLEAAPDAIVIVGADGLIVLVNRQTEATFGYQRAELLGQRVEMLLPDRFRTGHVDQRATYTAAPRTRPMGEGRELFGRRKDGSEFPVEISLSPMSMNGETLAISVIRDITVRKRSEEARLQLATIVESSEDAIIGYTLDGVITSWNRGAERMYGFAASEAIGRNAAMLVPSDRQEEFVSILARLRQKEPTHFETVRVHKDGSSLDVALTVSPIEDGSGTVSGGSAIARDITERRRIEQDLRHAIADAENARQEAERANQAKSDFLSRMSHELRTPLNAVLGFAQLLEMDPLTSTQHANIQRILKGGRHLLDLINEVLDIARIETGRLQLSPEPVRMIDAVREVLDLARPMADEYNVRIGVRAESECEHYVMADRQRLKQILLNLLANGIKYNRPGGSVSISCETHEESRLRVDVQDTGSGIAADMLDRLFSPFDRLGAERTEVEGTGLGLALTKGLVEALGGSIAVRSIEGEGSTFSVDLALVESPLARRERLEDGARALADSVTNGAAKTVLYIEDNLPNLELIEQIFARSTHIRLLAAMQGRLGLELAVQHQPDLILLDLHLPDIAGGEVLRRIRDNPRTRDIPVVIISADATSGQVERLLAGGAQHYLTKPLDVQRFLAIVGEILDEPGR